MSLQESESAATNLARATVTALVRYGVKEVVVCPGSRSAPLVYALATAEDAGWLRTHICLDERSAGFYALGLSLSDEDRSAPVSIVMTSGTAVANVHPAVLEATHAGVPLLVLSADRPHELRGTGANQTTEQVGIFGAAPVFAFDVPAGYDPARMDALLRRAVCSACGMFSGVEGVSHLNLCFADPLVPQQQWRPGQKPEVVHISRRSLQATPEGGSLAESPVTGIDWDEDQTVIVAGAGAGPESRMIAALTGWPLLAEPSSLARGSLTHAGDATVTLRDYQQALGLREPSELARQVKQIIQLGRPTLSRPVSRLLAFEQARLVVLSPGGQWADQAGRAAAVLCPVDAAEAARQWSQRHSLSELSGRGEWLERWQVASRPDFPAVSPQHLAARLWAESKQADLNLMIGASSIIRYFDRAADAILVDSDGPLQVFSNRGLAGIDGTLATARGVRRGTNRPTRVVLGDLTFLHDAMSLLPSLGVEDVLALPGLQVIVLNDGGGSIFAGLEHAAAPQALFDRFFRTEQHLDFAAFAQSVGAKYREFSLAEACESADFAPAEGLEIINVALK
ncbi:2-succinyl-5-enolpyruvyl-6-hydroxy-3-cyclohexene-1-carboxylic-acid synthase [Boudabousia marimammalium]|uniref:2-succinyl-5-enolpyruvyl-6-hydroxy-3-cyclohexene-1-carboxylate synthase n=2 Tax=Boudabousia marimammalium TaxID=156892 RepID=A0A1Q5PMU9_9ACTO|nr:2-succinyl-5-enolpyruvyl-6-hydroxy-3-cyclohexene-1-carboxylic-acid synthase [Boudabousia marimammalium]